MSRRRRRRAILDDGDYYAHRERVIGFLEAQAPPSCAEPPRSEAIGAMADLPIVG